MNETHDPSSTHGPGDSDRPASALASDFVVRTLDVSKVYEMGEQQTYALREVYLDIFRGEYMAIMGPSGSGKSTLFNMIGGLDSPTEGDVTVQGIRIAELSRDQQARLRNRCLGYIFQTYNLVPVMTATRCL